jgi:hypothetical protein
MRRELLCSPGAVRLDERLSKGEPKVFGNADRGVPLTLIDSETYETVDSIAVKQLIEAGRLVRKGDFYEPSNRE